MVANRPPRRVKKGEGHPEGSRPLFTIRDKDIESAKRIIIDRYGFTPPDNYVRDLIQFVNEMVNEPRS
jgi:DNA phosphorothioation-dependent restriction protein DptG